jgi:D-alanine-D-alanine ligase
VLPDTYFLRDAWEQDPEATLDAIEAALPYPIFIKPANLGSSIGIGKAADRAALREAVAVAASFDRRILAEKGLSKPQEVNCAVLGFGQDVTPSVCEMPVSTAELLSFQDKYLRGAKGGKGMQALARRVPAPISAEQTREAQRLACAAFQALDCKGVARVDMLLDEGGALCINEINTIPGSLAFYLWAEGGMPYPSLLERLVEYAFRAHAQKHQSVFAYDSTILQSYKQGKAAAKTAKR